jgi:uncharacterized protein (DUF1015 family)
VDPEVVEPAARLLARAGARPVYIADGHHRYETALRYRDSHTDNAEAGFVLALMYDAHSGGLALLPWHRLLSGVDERQLVDDLERWFFIERDLSADGLVAELSSASEAGVIGFWASGSGAILRVNRSHIEELLPVADSETLRWLDVSVLSATLSDVLGRTVAELTAEQALTYTSDARAALDTVARGDADVAFLLRASPTEAVLEVARAGGYMPAKSTFFHPKAATGLVFNTLSDGRG